jgi:hypothetical protein
MSCIVRPLRNPQICIDIRALLVETIALELARHCGGNRILNQLEAEVQLDSLLGESRDPDRDFNKYERR